MTLKKYFIQFIFVSTFSIGYSQQDSVRIETVITTNDGNDFNVKIDFLSRSEKFNAFGMTIPPFTNWSIGFPMTRFEQSFYLYTQQRKNLSWYSRLTVPVVTYNLAAFDIESFMMASELYVTGTYFYKSRTRETLKREKILLGSIKYYDAISKLYTTAQLPKKLSKGINFGYFVSNQFVTNNTPLLHHGIILGFSRRNELTIKSQVEARPGILENWRPSFIRWDRTFYTNLTVSVSQNFWNNPDENWKSIPIGINAGWLFLNKKNNRKGFTNWNIELGIRGPIFYEVPSYVDDPYPLFYFTYRGFVGGIIKK